MPPLMMPPPPPKKSYQPPSKTARDKYFARKTVDEVLKTQVKKRKSEEVSDDAILRSRYERRLERTLQVRSSLAVFYIDAVTDAFAGHPSPAGSTEY